MRFAAICLIARLIGASYNPSFEDEWPKTLDQTLFTSYDDSVPACSGENTANSQNCIWQIQSTLTDLYKNFPAISSVLGTSGSMTNWFLPNVQSSGVSTDYTLNTNYNFIKDTLVQLSTLIQGTTGQLATALGTSGNVVNFQTAVNTAKGNLQDLEPKLEDLKTLVPGLIAPFTKKVSDLVSSLSGLTELVTADDEAIETAVSNSKGFFDALGSRVVDDFAASLTLLDSIQTGIRTALLQQIGAIQNDLSQDIRNVTTWNNAQATFISTINNAISAATANLAAKNAALFATAMADQKTALTTSVLNPQILAFQTIQTTYNTLSGRLVSDALTDTATRIAGNRAAIESAVNTLSELSQYYFAVIANMSSNITNTAKTSLEDIKAQIVVANATQTGWQAQMNAKLKNIAETITGVAAAAKAQGAVTQSLAEQVLRKFHALIVNLRKAMNDANSIYSTALESGGNVAGGAAAGAEAAVEGSYSTAAVEVTTETGEQVNAVSTSSVNMMGSLADLLLSLNKLMTLQKEKMGSSTGDSNSALELVNKVASGNAQDLAQTMSDISAQQQSNLVNAQASGMASASDSSSSVGGIVDSVGAKTFKAVNDAQNMYADSEAASNKQIADMAADIQFASDASSNLEDVHNTLTVGSARTIGILNANVSSLKGLLDSAVAGMQVALNGAQSSAMSKLDSLNHSVFEDLQATGSETNLTVLELFNAYDSYLKAANRSVYAVPDMGKLAGAGSGSASLDQVGPIITQAVASFKSENDALNLGMAANKTNAEQNFSGIVAAAEGADIGSIAALVAFLTNSTLVKNIADVQAASQTKFGLSISSAYSTLGDIGDLEATEQGVGIQTSALNGSMIDLQSLVLDSFADAKSQATNDSRLALEIIQNETTRGLNTSQSLNDLILKTQEELNALNVSVLAQIANTTSVIDLNAVVDHLNQFLGAVLAQQSQYFNITSNQAALRAAIITGQQADLYLLRSQEKTDLIAGKAEYATRQTSVLGVANQLTNTIGKLAASSGADVSAWLDNLASIRGISDKLSSSLQSYVSSAGSRMRAETNLAAQQLENLAKGNVMTRSLAAAAVDRNLINSMDSFNASSRSFENLVSYSSGGLMGVGQMVKDLNTAQSIQLQLLLNQIESGKMTLQQALASAVELSTADLSSIGDVASAFATIIYQYIGLTEQTFSDAETVLNNFQASASDTIGEYGAALQESLDSVTDLVTLGQSVSGDMSTGFDSALSAVKGNLTIEMGHDSDEAVSVGNTKSFITGLIDNATAEFANIAAMENKAATSLTEWAQINIHNFLTNVAPTGTLLGLDSQSLVWSE